MSITDLFHRLSTQASELVRKEIQLARVELMDKVKAVGNSAVLFGVAAVFALGAFGALIVTLIAAIALVVPVWGSALIVTVLCGIAAAICALLGKKQLAAIASPVPEKSIQNVRRDIAATQEAVDRARARPVNVGLQSIK